MAVVGTYALVSLDSVREALGFEETQVTDDNILAGLINRLSARIETYCGYKFKGRSFTEYHNGLGWSPSVFVSNPPIISVSEVWDDTDRAFTDSANDLISSGDYMIYASEGEIRLYNNETVFSKGHQNIKITYSGGYDSIPEDLQGACILFVMRDYRMIKDKIQGYMTKSAGGTSQMIDMQAIPRDVKAVLDSYKLIRVNDDT